MVSDLRMMFVELFVSRLCVVFVVGVDSTHRTQRRVLLHAGRTLSADRLGGTVDESR